MRARPWAVLEDMLNVWSKESGDWRFKCDVGRDCCWGGEVRITPQPKQFNFPETSVVIQVNACGGPDEVAERLLPLVSEYLQGLKKQPDEIDILIQEFLAMRDPFTHAPGAPGLITPSASGATGEGIAEGEQICDRPR